MEKEIGKMQSDIEYLKRNDEDLKGDIRDIKKDLTEIKQVLHTVGGGWKVFLMFGSFCAAIGGALVKVISFFSWPTH